MTGLLWINFRRDTCLFYHGCHQILQWIQMNNTFEGLTKHPDVWRPIAKPHERFPRLFHHKDIHIHIHINIGPQRTRRKQKQRINISTIQKRGKGSKWVSHTFSFSTTNFSSSIALMCTRVCEVCFISACKWAGLARRNKGIWHCCIKGNNNRVVLLGHCAAATPPFAAEAGEGRRVYGERDGRAPLTLGGWTRRSSRRAFTRFVLIGWNTCAASEAAAHLQQNVHAASPRFTETEETLPSSRKSPAKRNCSKNDPAAHRYDCDDHGYCFIGNAERRYTLTPCTSSSGWNHMAKAFQSKVKLVRPLDLHIQ